MKAAIGATAAMVAGPAVWALVTRQGDDGGAPAIAYGRDRCEQCGMVIGDARFAAAARQGSTVRRFDDIGCLIRHSGEALASRSARGFVHDVDAETWLDAPGAWYVRTPAIHTPMNYGIAAYADAGGARRAYPRAPVLAFADLLAALAKEQT